MRIDVAHGTVSMPQLVQSIDHLKNLESDPSSGVRSHVMSTVEPVHRPRDVHQQPELLRLLLRSSRLRILQGMSSYSVGQMNQVQG